MGADFPEKAKKTFKKSWDAGRVALGTPDLFTQQPQCTNTTVVMEMSRSVVLSKGEKLVVESSPTGLVVKRGLTEVGRCKNPTEQIRQSLSRSSEIACGVVQEVHALAQVAEISLC